MPRIIRQAFSLLCLICLMDESARADTLLVGTPFPDIEFRLEAGDQPARLSRLQDLVRTKTIAFIFASW